MNNIFNGAKKLCHFSKKLWLYKDAVIYEDQSGIKKVIKKSNNIDKLYNYLRSRGFDYIPLIEYYDENYYMYKYIDDINTPNEQKASDLINLYALLHNKTLYYKDVSIDEIKELYDYINNKIEYTLSYYENIIEEVENSIYISPSKYMLARNYSSIISCLNFCKIKLDKWYELSKERLKKRIVLLHNNPKITHVIRNDKKYLISWNNAYRDNPIYDFIKFYKNYYDKYDFCELYNEYIKKFPLLKDEKTLLFTILFIPDIINFNNCEIKNTLSVYSLFNYLFKTDKLFMENEAKDAKKQDNKIYEQKKDMESNT